MGHASHTASQGVLPGDARKRPIWDVGLWRRIGFVVAALLVVRLGGYITLPGLDLSAVSGFLSRETYQRMSIFSLGIWPYISASIFVQVFIWIARITPKLMEVEKRRRINTYIRVVTIVSTLLQGLAIAISLTRAESDWGSPFITYDSSLFIISTMATMTAGALFLVWLADEITKRGLGNGVILILAVSSLQHMLLGMAPLWDFMRQSLIPPNTLLIIVAVFLAAVALVVFVENARLYIPVRFPGQKTASGTDREEQLPLRLNHASTIYSPILASSVLLLPLTIYNFTQTGEADWYKALGQGMPLHMFLYAVLIALMTYGFLPNMGTAQAIAGKLATQGGEIPGVPAGASTAAYIRQRLLWASAPVPFYMAAICVLPEMLAVSITPTVFIGGLPLLIVVIALSDIIRGVRQSRSGSSK